MSVITCNNCGARLKDCACSGAELKAFGRGYEKALAGWKKDLHEIEQILGKALGYPWYWDDQENFPGATKEDGVCVGDHVAATLAMEAADRIRRANAAAVALCIYEIQQRKKKDPPPGTPDKIRRPPRDPGVQLIPTSWFGRLIRRIFRMKD